MLKMLVPKVTVMATKAITIKPMVVAMVRVIGRPMVGPIVWMPISSKGICLIPLKGINQGICSLYSLG